MFVKHSMPLVKWFQNRQISFKTKCCIHFWPVNAKCDLAIAGTDLGLARHTSSQYGEHMRELISKQVDRFPTIWSRHKTLYSFRISIAKGNFDLAGMDLGPGHLTQYGEKRRNFKVSSTWYTWTYHIVWCQCTTSQHHVTVWHQQGGSLYVSTRPQSPQIHRSHSLPLSRCVVKSLQ